MPPCPRLDLNIALFDLGNRLRGFVETVIMILLPTAYGPCEEEMWPVRMGIVLRIHASLVSGDLEALEAAPALQALCRIDFKLCPPSYKYSTAHA
jgi:hypothetical protein